MRIRYSHTYWGSDHLNPAAFAKAIAEAGYEGMELFLIPGDEISFWPYSRIINRVFQGVPTARLWRLWSRALLKWRKRHNRFARSRRACEYEPKQCRKGVLHTPASLEPRPRAYAIRPYLIANHRINMLVVRVNTNQNGERFF
jgi:hypothetical protein